MGLSHGDRSSAGIPSRSMALDPSGRPVKPAPSRRKPPPACAWARRLR
ncbi:extensin family protein [Variovorax paradoxus B4]|uniref:Extensin family protein n=1 Tax=Variovorax paradoxus B4 TaxID=1246301 RepID=T1XE65_VARPD|nr:extensin family protein [Variovorax paradoxus B4]